MKILPVLIIGIAFGLTAQADISVSSITHQGLGCPAGSASTALAPDGSAITILYSALSAELLQGSPVLTDVKKCWTKINLALPADTQLVIESADYRGFYSLPSDQVIASFNTRYFFLNGAALRGRNYMAPWSVPGGFGVNQTGPKTEEFTWNTQNYGGANILQVTPCGGATELNITNLVGLTAFSTADGSAVFDSMDAKMRQVYRIRRVSCQYRFRPYPGRPHFSPETERVGGVIWREL